MLTYGRASNVSSNVPQKANSSVERAASRENPFNATVASDQRESYSEISHCAVAPFKVREKGINTNNVVWAQVRT